MADGQHERFFSRSHIYRAAWSALLAVGGFGAGLVWSHYKGKEPVIVRVERLPDDPEFKSLEQMEELKAEVRRLRTQQSPAPRKERQASAHEQEPPPAPRAQSSLDSRRTHAAIVNSAYTPALRLPDSVKGFTNGRLSGFGEASCPPDKVGKEDVLVLQLLLEQHVDPTQLTPALVRIDRRESAKHLVRIQELQYVLARGMNTFRVPVDVPAGEYELSMGFYARAELNQEYPTFHHLACKLVVQ